MKISWAWNNALNSSQIFAASSHLIGHEVTQLELRGNINLYNGVRQEIVIFNNEYLFLNYLKKGNFLKKLACSGSDFYFTTHRLEFFSFIKLYAKICGATPIEFVKFMDLTKIINGVEKEALFEDYKCFLSKNDPVIFLFNNDNLGTRGLLKEIKLKNYLTISAADSNSLNTNAGGFIPFYGNDDSITSIAFLGKFFCKTLRNVKPETFSKPPVSFKTRPRLSSENEVHIIRRLKSFQKKF